MKERYVTVLQIVIQSFCLFLLLLALRSGYKHLKHRQSEMPKDIVQCTIKQKLFLL